MASTVCERVGQHRLLDDTGLQRDGVTAPRALLGFDETGELVAACRSLNRARLPWIKSWHALVPEVFDVASRPALCDQLVPVLGADVMLWGSQFIRQGASSRHRWHVDVEHAAWPGVTVWLGLQNVSGRSGMIFITGTHELPVTPQELSLRHGLDTHDDAAVLQAARRLNANCELIEVNVREGEFVTFLGRTWHASRNLTDADRLAIIFQYARPNVRVQIPTSFNPPHVTWSSTSPPCVIVRGTDRWGLNMFVDRSNVGAHRSFPHRGRFRQYLERLVGEVVGWTRNHTNRTLLHPGV